MTINRIPIQVLADTLQVLWTTSAMEMVWCDGKVLITTLPSKAMTF